MGVKALAALATTAALLVVAAPADAVPRPVNEGGDYRHCVTYDESMVIFLGMPRHRAERILDTRGHRGGRRVLAAAAGIVHNPMRARTVAREYPICPGELDTPPSTRFVVEYSNRSDAHRVVSVVWT